VVQKDVNEQMTAKKTTINPASGAPVDGSKVTDLTTAYRPRTFDEVVGQDATVKGVRAYVAKARAAHAAGSVDYPHALLFSGVSGCGKTTLAFIVARALVCENIQPGYNPCGECDSCLAVFDYETEESNPLCAKRVIASKGMANMAAVGDLISYTSVRSPLPSGLKIVIIDECHRMSAAAQDALLGELEDKTQARAKGTIWMFCTTEVKKVQPAVLNRTTPYVIKGVSDEKMAPLLRRVADQAGVSVDDQMVDTAVFYGGGSIRSALQYLGQLADGLPLALPKSLDLFEAILRGDMRTAVNVYAEDEAGGFELSKRLHSHFVQARNYYLELNDRVPAQERQHKPPIYDKDLLRHGLVGIEPLLDCMCVLSSALLDYMKTGCGEALEVTVTVRLIRLLGEARKAAAAAARRAKDAESGSRPVSRK
jgi:DNA polymerase III gamma/tau subunit